MKPNGVAKNMKTSRNAIFSIAGAILWVCATAAFAAENSAPAGTPLNTFFSAGSAVPHGPWRVVGLPKGKQPLTRFDITPLDGQPVLRIQTDHSYGNLVHDLPDFALAPGMQLRWRWRLDQPLRQADLRQREGDDSPLKVCVLFDLPVVQLGFVERSLMGLARTVSGEKLPAATLCYVWDATLAPGTLLHNAYTHRVRMIVLDSGEQRLGQWVTHRQDLAADFRRAFGQESATVPPLLAVLVGADSDNKGGQSLGYVGDVTLSP